MTPAQMRRLRQWLNPLRVLCEFGWHRDDGEIKGSASYVGGGLRHCGRCRRPWWKGGA